MKKIFLAVLLTITSAAAVINPVFSQESSNDIAYHNKMSAWIPTDYEATALHTKAVRDLHKSFGTNSDVKWYKRQNGYMAVFVKDAVKFRVDYDSKGNWNGTLKNYNEEKLSRDIRAIVKSVYFDYSIKWIWEINVTETNNRSVYIVHIEDEKSFKNLQVYDGEVKVLEHFEKAISGK